MSKVRVLVVEDSLTVRRRLCEVLSSDPAIEVVGEAEDGQRAIELCRELRPSVVTMDMILPLMTGLEATEYLMAHIPTPILVVSASFNRGELFKTFDALAAGAVDVMEKPRGDEHDAAWEKTFLATVKLVSRIKVITHLRGRMGSHGRLTPTALPRVAAAPAPVIAPAHGFRAIGIGASTGGPGALVSVLRMLPASHSVPVLMVLHIDEPFGAAFAEWLGTQIRRSVVYARDGEPLSDNVGRVMMAPPGRHLTVRGNRLRLTSDPERHSCRPSVDVLFESMARELGAACAGCLLTGMGRDGASGLLEIRKAGGYTIAQDEATSVVYGMPREAALLGAAISILPLDDIGQALGQVVGGAERQRP